MRTFIVIAVLVAIAFLAGWLKFYRNGDQAGIEVDGTEIRSDTDHVIQESKELIEKGKEKLDANRPNDTITP
jgi:hypothetical protein